MKSILTKEKGQSLIEFALILPILLILVGGIIDFGWLFYNQSSLNNAAREGARYAIVQTAKTERIQLITNKINSVTPQSLKPVTIEISYSNMQTPLLGDVTIKLSSQVRILTPVMGVFVSGQKRTLSAQATMKVES
ncbi:MAG TPA: TadE/TadG family type IV pilus assembly protein [Oscillospiraceae bacterium]|nr:TadE/TadG family type IV pilus assembly protein [Oscillospiraceae bacterium]